MKWLIVSLETKKNSDVVGLERFLKKCNVEIRYFDPEKKSKKTFVDFSEIEYCIWLNKKDYQYEESVTLLLGYFLGKNIPLFFVWNQPSNEERELFLISEELREYDSLEDLQRALDERFPLFLKREEEKKAKEKLLDMGIPFNADSFAFHIASNNEEECDLFLKAGIDVNSRDSAGTPMICIAARYDRLEMVEKLIAAGVDIDAVSKDRGYSAVMDAVWKSNTEVVERLVKEGADLTKISRDGQPILVLAVGTNNETVCKVLAENGADPRICDAMGMSALSYAKLFKKDNLVKIFEAVSDEC